MHAVVEHVSPDVKGYFDKATSTISYVVSDPTSGHSAIIDPVLDYDPKSGRSGTESVDRIIAYTKARDLTVDWILETHVHADHLTAAPHVKKILGGQVGIGKRISCVQKVFAKVFNIERDVHTDGSQFDHLFEQDEVFTIGNVMGRVMHTPGHTPACSTYVIHDCAFIGDTIFMPDYGTARCDFPGGDSSTLYHSIQNIYSLHPDTRLFTCHDYQPSGRQPQWESTVAQQRASNIHVNTSITESEFVKMRNERDATLAMPTLLLPAIQINMRAGTWPTAEDNGISYLKIPLNAL